MRVIIVTLLLSLLILLKADNISISGLIEESEYWYNDSEFLDFNLSATVQAVYGFDIQNDNQRFGVLMEYSDLESYGFGINWLQKIKPQSLRVFRTEICIGPQLIYKSSNLNWEDDTAGFGLWSSASPFKYASGNIEAAYLTPSLVINVDNYLYNTGLRLYFDIGYNLLLAQNSKLKFNEAPDKIKEPSLQSDLSIRIGAGLLFGFTGYKNYKNDFQ